MLASKIVLLSTLLTTVMTPKGGNISGGGEILGDVLNPWFIQNTKEITYCIDIDRQNFGQTEDVADKQIRKAFSFWQREFASARPYQSSPIVLATQSFLKVPCSEQTLLRFQLGQLTDEQKILFPDQQKYIAAAIRTSYDTVNLRGKGFVYIAPESGPLRITLEGAIDKPWQQSDGKLLYMIFLHELGHVFGIPHGGSGIDSLMSPQFPESIVSDELGPIGLYFWRDPGIVKSAGIVRETCRNIDERVLQFYGAPSELACLIMAYDGKHLQIRGRLSEQGQDILIGETERRFSFIEHGNALTWLYLSPNQKVFEKELSGRHILGPAIIEETYALSYRDVSGKTKRDLVMMASPLNLHLTSNWNGAMIRDFTFVSISSQVTPSLQDQH